MLNSVFTGLRFQGCSTPTHSRGQTHSFSFEGLELKCQPTLSPKEIKIYGSLSISAHVGHYLKVSWLVSADCYLL